MGSIHPDPERLRALVEGEDAEPVVMINLLRFREEAEYPPDRGFEPCSGAEAYARYAAEAGPHLERAGARVIWRGAVEGLPIGPPDEVWHEVLLVEYPSRRAFLSMVSAPEYRAITVHRTAALADSRLIAARAEPAALSPPGSGER